MTLRYRLPWTRGNYFCLFFPDYVNWLLSVKVQSLFIHGLEQLLFLQTLVAAQGFYKSQFSSHQPTAVFIHSLSTCSEFSLWLQRNREKVCYGKSKIYTKLEKNSTITHLQQISAFCTSYFLYSLSQLFFFLEYFKTNSNNFIILLIFICLV